MSRYLRISLLAVLGLSVISLSSCSFGTGEPKSPVVTPVPEVSPTDTPIPTPTISPNMQETTYTSSDKAMSIKMPDATWTVKADETKMKSFESPKQGSILILHGKGEDELSSVLIPDTLDLALSMEKASQMVEGVDFEMINYTTEEVGPVGIYSYIVHYMDSKKSGGYNYVINQYYVTDDEYYNLVGSVKKEKYLGDIGTALASFKVLDGPISQAATGAVQTVEMDETGTGESTPDAGEASSAGGEGVPFQGNTGSYTEEQLSDIWSTRTIYRNSDGVPIVVTPDGAGGWVDEYGNSYYYETDEDVYDQNGVDYYWHGEAGDVAFMPVG